MTLEALFPATDPAELRARLRSLRMASRLLCGPRGRELEHALTQPNTMPTPCPWNCSTRCKRLDRRDGDD